MLVLGADGAYCEGREFPCSAHYDDPAEPDFLVKYSLVDVGAEGEAEENGEDNGGGERWVVIVICIAGPFGDVAIRVWRHVYTCCCR